MWVLDHLDDLESDFSVFHRVEDIHSMPGPRFFRLAMRIFAYDGVMTARMAAEQDNNRTTGEVDVVDSNRDAVSTSPAFQGLVSWGGGSGG